MERPSWCSRSARSSAHSKWCRSCLSASRWEDLRMSRSRPWVQKYRWPIYFFVSVAFWNLVGAGLFGFMINPPIALYSHAGLEHHAGACACGVVRRVWDAGDRADALFLAGARPTAAWKDGLVTFGFWATNVGLFAMVTFSLLPVGLMQTWASVEHGYWYARSPEFLQTGAIEMFRWLRVVGDTIFAAGAVALAIFRHWCAYRRINGAPATPRWNSDRWVVNGNHPGPAMRRTVARVRGGSTSLVTITAAPCDI